MKFNKITDLNLTGKVVFIRTDMNVPLDDNGAITDDTRIKAGVNSIKYALENGAKVIVATHLGRPTEGVVNKEDSVLPVAKRLGNLIGLDVPVIENWQNGVSFSSGNLLMLENVRCNVGEKKNSDELGKKYAALCDVFCYDAFATAHRAEASTNSVGIYAKEICAGLLMAKELEALSKAVSSPQKPVVAVVAGSKVSTKLTILNNLADKVDTLIVGGGILNTFLMANGKDVAGSLVEADLINEAKQVIDKMSARGASVPLPYDVVVAEKFAPDAKAVEKHLDDIKSGEMILDIGSSFANQLAEIIAEAGTIIWNGPVGVFEFDQFANGTRVVANAIANSNGFSLAGGGDTIAAINKFSLFDKISYVSTAGGALLEFLEGKELPAVKLLTSR